MTGPREDAEDKKSAPAGLFWHFEKKPEEKHATIYHPAALRAFRALFEPEAPEK